MIERLHSTILHKHARLVKTAAITLLLLSAQSVLAAHESTHLHHDESELCLTLANFGAGNDLATANTALEIAPTSPADQIDLVTPSSSISIAADTRSRSPPLPFLI